MRATVLSAIVAGLAAGVVFGLFLTVVTLSGPEQPVVTLMQLVVRALGSDRLLVGWLVTVAASAVVGLVFGALAGRTPGPDAVATRALACGLALWLASALVGLPWLLGRPLGDLEMWARAASLLVPHLLFSSVLAVVFSWLRAGRGAGRSGARPGCEERREMDLTPPAPQVASSKPEGLSGLTGRVPVTRSGAAHGRDLPAGLATGVARDHFHLPANLPAGREARRRKPPDRLSVASGRHGRLLPQGRGAQWPLGQIYRGMLAFMLLQVVGLALVFFFLSVALWLPQLLFG